MPGPADVVRCVFKGSILDATSGGQVVEQFAHQITVMPSNTAAVTDWQAATVDIVGSVAAEFVSRWSAAVSPNVSAARTWFPATVRYDELRGYHLNAAGLTEHLASAALLVSGSPAVGTDSAAQQPSQCSVAVSLYSYGIGAFNPDGRHGRGRFFLPPLGVDQLGTTGLIGTAQRDNIATWWGGILNAVAGGTMTTPGGPMRLVLPGSDGVARDVERLRVGRVVDTQRRRRRSLNEAYVDRVIEPA